MVCRYVPSLHFEPEPHTGADNWRGDEKFHRTNTIASPLVSPHFLRFVCPLFCLALSRF